MKYYLTTPIYYTNGAPHIGHAYTTIVCDAIRRLKRMQEYDVVLTTGADEHGVNVERSAEKVGKTPYDFSTMMADEFRAHWDELRIPGDEFVRTSDDRHKRTVQWLFQRCRDNGYVYKGTYTGQYCIFDNLYVNEAKPGDPCPECGRPTETVTEENFFFKLSEFQEKLLELYESEPQFIHPGDAAQRGDPVRAGRTERSFDHPNDDQVGDSGARRRAARFLRLVRRFDGIPHRRRRTRVGGPRSVAG